jgi:hypothetical protein
MRGGAATYGPTVVVVAALLHRSNAQTLACLQRIKVDRKSKFALTGGL